MSARRNEHHRERLFDAITAGDDDATSLFVDPPQAPPEEPLPKAVKTEEPVRETPPREPPPPPTAAARAAEPPSRRPLSLLRLTFFWSAMTALVLASTEGMGLFAYHRMTDEPFSFATLRSMRASVIAEPEEQVPSPAGSAVQKNGDSELVVHPYLGYIQSPGDKWVTDAHGIFYGTKPLITEADPGRVVVGIFGGSLAEQFSAQGTASLEAALAEDPRFAGKEIAIVPVAFAGYKQPQQLIALNYLLSLGAHFDLLVNVDGFNEVALSTAVNGPKNVSPFFPSSWGSLVNGLPDTGTLKLIGKTVNLKDIRRAWAGAFQGDLGSVGVTPNVVWLAGDRFLASSIAAAQRAIVTEEETPKKDDLALGPKMGKETNEELLESLADGWERSSLQMAEVAKAKGIPYFHFLQPNQYVPDSKPIGEAEAKTALSDKSPYKPWVIEGYPHLREAGKRLKASGVRFTDLTDVFSGVEDPVYGDDCCHLNQNGYAILGSVIGKTIVTDQSVAPTKE